MENIIKQLAYLSNYIGVRSDLIQAGGGNTSVKFEDKMHIKSSGVKLSDLNSNSGFSTVNYKHIINNLFNDETENDMLQESLIAGNKPSIETFLHAFTLKYTIHTHPILFNVLSVRKDAELILKKLFPDVLIIQYIKPGIELARVMVNKLERNSDKNKIIFLKNHGMIVSSDDFNEVITLNNTVIKKIADFLSADINRYLTQSKLFSINYELSKEKIIYLVDNEQINRYLKTHHYKLWNYALTPDCVVYCGNKELYLTDNSISENVFDLQTDNTNLIIYKNQLFIRAGTINKAKEIEELLIFSLNIIQLNEKNDIASLNKKDQDVLLNWDAEKYRKKFNM